MPVQIEPGIEANTYHSFVVRLWQEHSHGPWRASVLSVQTGQVTGFASLEGLYAFLQAQTTDAQTAATQITDAHIADTDDRPDTERDKFL